MKGLIIKDILNLKKNLNTLLFLVIFYAFLGYRSGDPSMLIAMIVLLLTMMSITSISYDDLAKWDKYALAMPISRKNIVLSKYILAVLLSISGVVLSTAIAYVIIILKGNISTPQLLLISYIIFIISILFSCIVLPLVYRFGVEKSRLMMMAVIGVPMAIAYFLNEMGATLPDENQLKILLKISPLIILLILFVSFSISYRIYKNKDL